MKTYILRIASSLPAGDDVRKKLLAVAREQFVLRIRIPKTPEGRALREKAIRIIGRKHLELEIPYSRGFTQISFVVQDERKAINLWRAAERKLGVKVDMELEEL